MQLNEEEKGKGDNDEKYSKKADVVCFDSCHFVDLYFCTVKFCAGRNNEQEG